MKAPAAAEILYRSNCARCHGVDGRGDTPLGNVYQAPDLTDRHWWYENRKTASTSKLIAIVSQGKGGMPAFGKKLKRNEVYQLVRYMKRFRR